MADLRAALHSFDDRVEGWIDPLRGSAGLDRLFYTLSAVGDHGMIWLGLGVGRSLRTADPLRSSSRFAALLGAESVLVNGLIKSLFKRRRPIHEGQRPLHLREPLTSSFPSGHASSAFMSAVLLAEGSDYATAYYGLAALVATSRVYVRIHHASDVVAGTAIGLALGHLARRFDAAGWHGGRRRA